MGTKGVSLTTEYTRAAASWIKGNTSRLSMAAHRASLSGKIYAYWYYRSFKRARNA
jgi:hypothetical protein